MVPVNAQQPVRIIGSQTSSLPSRFLLMDFGLHEHFTAYQRTRILMRMIGIMESVKYMKKNSNTYRIHSHFSMHLVGARIFFKYNAGDSFKMDIPYGNKELVGKVSL